MPKLEQLIGEWRSQVKAQIGSETLDELENHLRETVERLVQSGMTETEAFARALEQLGTPATLGSEFRKLTNPSWLPVKLAAVMEALILLLSLLGVALSKKFRSDGLLAVHVFLVTFGYLTVFLNGALGICFVGQRCYSEFSASRLQGLRRAIMIFCSLAALPTTVAVILGAFWAKAAWGRYWAWDLKETGGFCVILWTLLLWGAARWRRIPARAVVLAGILGNIVVGLAWFGANLLSGVHAYGAPNGYVLLAALAAHLAIFLVGLGPAGWLRPRFGVR